MSGNNYGYYYPQNSSAYPEKQWSDWSIEQQQYNNANFIRNTPYDPNTVNHSSHSSSHPSPRNSYYNYHNTPQTNGRPYHQQRRYNGGNNQYSPGQQAAWNRNTGYKRTRLDSEDLLEPKSKTSKKKKKPLSQNVPSKKDWTMEDAEKALACEKEHNKRNKNQSLIIKFPDLELNKEIVSKFHSSIENVHFQQPSTARFCFVTIEESADADAVISALNKVKFGDGYLTAEYKKDREEDQNIGPEDIDPHTLYVGNLAQEITKEDMVKTYPKCKRIDIGYAKKMKYTRYAFVTFKTVADSVEAFKKTHSTQMYSKSLIVRFRRLHGTVGMPGETKPQNPPKNKENTTNSDETSIINNENEQSACKEAQETESINLNLVKQEPESSDDENIIDKASLPSNNESFTIADDIDVSEPIPKIKVEPKDEFKCLDVVDLLLLKDKTSDIKDKKVKTEVKAEPEENYDLDNKDSEDENESSAHEDNEEEQLESDVNFTSLYNKLLIHANNINSIKKTAP